MDFVFGTSNTCIIFGERSLNGTFQFGVTFIQKFLNFLIIPILTFSTIYKVLILGIWNEDCLWFCSICAVRVDLFG